MCQPATHAVTIPRATAINRNTAAAATPRTLPVVAIAVLRLDHHCDLPFGERALAGVLNVRTEEVAPPANDC